MHLLKEFYGKLPDDKIKIKWNKNPIRMDIFLEFLTVSTIRSNDHLGSCNGWTKLQNKELNLSISGGIVCGIEYLDSLSFGEKLANPYNNFVNPFYLWEILTKKGMDFFYIYYDAEITERTDNLYRMIKSTKTKLKNLTGLYNKIIQEG